MTFTVAWGRIEEWCGRKLQSFRRSLPLPSTGWLPWREGNKRGFRKRSPALEL